MTDEQLDHEGMVLLRDNWAISGRIGIVICIEDRRSYEELDFETTSMTRACCRDVTVYLDTFFERMILDRADLLRLGTLVSRRTAV